MSRPRALLVIVVCLLTPPSLATAQEAAANTSEDAKAVEKQAFELLDAIAQGIPSLRNSGNRVYLMSAVADLLWTKDEKRAVQIANTSLKKVDDRYEVGLLWKNDKPVLPES